MNQPGFINCVGKSLNAVHITPNNTIATRPGPASAALQTRSQAPISAPTLHTQLVPAHESSLHHSDGGIGKGSGRVIVLFRNDLRLDDHPALSHALEEAATVIPVYCFDPRHFGRTDYGYEKTSRYRAKFLLESIEDVRRSLQAKGSDLVVRFGSPEDVIPSMCKKLNVRSVFMHREVTYEEQKVEMELAKVLKEQGAHLSTFWANTLYHEDDLPFDINNMPDVYSDFREAVEKDGTIRTPLQVADTFPSLPKGLDSGKIPTLSALGIDDSPEPPAKSGVSVVTGGETEAVQRVATYVNETMRQGTDLSPRLKVTAHLAADFSCRISPWLVLGCVSPRRIFEEMKKACVRSETLLRSTTYYELVWRDFFRCITAKYSNRRANAAAQKVGQASLARV